VLLTSQEPQHFISVSDFLKHRLDIQLLRELVIAFLQNFLTFQIAKVSYAILVLTRCEHFNYGVYQNLKSRESYFLEHLLDFSNLTVFFKLLKLSQGLC
jgi:hypothetical protein